MNNNPRIMPDATQLRELFRNHVASYAKQAANAEREYAETRTQCSKHEAELTMHVIVAIVVCYSNATNMTFAQAYSALCVTDAILEESL